MYASGQPVTIIQNNVACTFVAMELSNARVKDCQVQQRNASPSYLQCSGKQNAYLKEKL
jgi:hypothetical protein